MSLSPHSSASSNRSHSSVRSIQVSPVPKSQHQRRLSNHTEEEEISSGSESEDLGFNSGAQSLQVHDVSADDLVSMEEGKLSPTAEKRAQEREEAATPIHIIEILLQSSTDKLPGIKKYGTLPPLTKQPSTKLAPISTVHRIEMLRRRSTSSVDEAAARTTTATATNDSGSSSSDHVLRTRRLNRQATLTLLTLEEDEMRIPHQKRKSSDDIEAPPDYSAAIASTVGAGRPSLASQSSAFTARARPFQNGTLPNSQGQQQQQQARDNRLAASESGGVGGGLSGSLSFKESSGSSMELERARREREQHQQHETFSSSTEDCCGNSCWPWFLRDRPVLRLFIVIFFNGLVSMMMAAIFIELEEPAQKQRFDYKKSLANDVKLMEQELTRTLSSRANTSSADETKDAVEKFVKYSEKLRELCLIPTEIKWDMLSSSAFVTSISSTTGYGDIVPVTTEGKVMTLIYALYGIPVFIWYIVKLGALFRVLVMRLINIVGRFARKVGRQLSHSRLKQQLTGVFVTASRPIDQSAFPGINEEFQDDKRFHPLVIGSIVLVFMLCVAAFISYMEGFTYFDAFYACFITYSTIGFGDIDIYKTSYRSNWFNLMIYGNLVHITGYMMVSAWISSILNKIGVRKH